MPLKICKIHGTQFQNAKKWTMKNNNVKAARVEPRNTNDI